MTDQEFLSVSEANGFGAVARGEWPVVPTGVLRVLLEEVQAQEREFCAKFVEQGASDYADGRVLAASLRAGEHRR